ncbi:MAG: IS1380 family transposase [Egibacteraceae bacterium]
MKATRKTPPIDDCPALEVSADGRGMTGRAGLGLLARTANRVGLTKALSDAVGGCRSWRDHDPGKVVRDLVLTLADGGDALRHLKVLDGQAELFGSVASASTANRTMVALGDDELVVERLADARRATRQRVWDAGGAPPVVAAAHAAHAAQDTLSGENDENGRDWRLYMDADATLIACQCDDRDGRRQAAPTFKKGFGTHPLMVYLDRGDGSGESLAGLLRPGNAGSNTADDHIEVFEMALAALPELPAKVELVVRTDTAGCTYKFLHYLRQAKVGFSVGFEINEKVRTAIRSLPDDAWVQARRQNGQPREGAAVAEITHLLDLSGYPEGSRVIVRREPLHPGAQQTLFDVDGKRLTAFLTDQPDTDLAGRDSCHREHAHVEDRIRGAKDTGARNLPCETFERNAVWLQLVMLAQDLMVWTQALTFDGRLRLAEPATLRYQVLHAPARIVRSGRRLKLKIQHDWPWAAQLVAAFQRLDALPLPAT